VRRLRKAASLTALACLAGLALATTASAVPPAVTAEAATEVTAATARAHGRVNPGTEEAFYRFEFITDTQYDRNQREGDDPFAGAVADGFGRLGAGAGEIQVSPLLGEAGGLEASTEYHLRLVAESEDGEAIAIAPNFTTPTAYEPIPCFGDTCQVLPPEPRDPALGTTVAGLGNPKVHYSRYGRKAKKHHKHRKHHKKSNKGKRSSARAAR
jgi:hypothetical protein